MGDWLCVFAGISKTETLEFSKVQAAQFDKARHLLQSGIDAVPHPVSERLRGGGGLSRIWRLGAREASRLEVGGSQCGSHTVVAATDDLVDDL